MKRSNNELREAVLAVVWDRGPCRPRDIASAADITKRVVSRVLGELERDGAVTYANEIFGDRRARYYVAAELA